MHIFTATKQKATSYKCDAGFRVKFKPRKLIYCDMCKERRWAKNLSVKSYYDGDRFFCMIGKGCNK